MPRYFRHYQDVDMRPRPEGKDAYNGLLSGDAPQVWIFKKPKNLKQINKRGATNRKWTTRAKMLVERMGL